jgi:hypothetical protein
LAASADHDDVVITVEITPLGSEGTSQTGQDTANPTDWNLDPSGSGGVPTSSGGLPTGASPTGDEPGNKLPGAGASIVWLMVAALGLTGAGAWLRRRQAQLGD